MHKLLLCTTASLPPAHRKPSLERRAAPQAWIRDLSDTSSDVNKAVAEAREKRAEIERQMAAADPDEAEGWHRLLWYRHVCWAALGWACWAGHVGLAP